jgi:2-polyprenyl-6-methoxyphenol hydroxylase-like FAD-dependent oxidoreductase
LSWPRVPGVTLIGDAAHLAPPAGEGANLALLDGAELAAAITAHPNDREAALAAYERAMFARAATSASDAHRMLELMIDEQAPLGMLDFFDNAVAHQDARSASTRQPDREA